MKQNADSIEQYWKDNFSNDRVINTGKDLQKNIARTKNGKPVEQDVWKKTLEYIKDLTKIDHNSDVLELCCGNGVIIGELALQCKSALGVDYSKKLLQQLNDNYIYENLETIEADVRQLKLSKKYDVIIIYFSIQHFDETDTLLLLEQCLSQLKKGGRMLIGDIPDMDRKWHYVRVPAHRKDYFQRVAEKRPKIGYWYQAAFFEAMESYFDGVEINALKQPDYQINSDHCFDVLVEKL